MLLVLNTTMLLAAHAQAPLPEHPRQEGGERMRLTTAETLVGRWTGRWQGAGGTASGSLGVVLARVPGHDTVVGQFTFIEGATARTVRYEGHLENGSVTFPLVAGGHIVLEATPDARNPLRAATLAGTWVEHRGALPVSRGTLELEPTS